MGNQNKISPENINTKPSRQVMKIQENILLLGLLVDPKQNSPTIHDKNLSKTIRKITNEILGVKTCYG